MSVSHRRTKRKVVLKNKPLLIDVYVGGVLVEEYESTRYFSRSYIDRITNMIYDMMSNNKTKSLFAYKKIIAEMDARWVGTDDRALDLINRIFSNREQVSVVVGDIYK